jgi:hypothetical protein
MAYNTIKIRKYSDVIEEHVAGAAIIPGMLLAIASTDKVVKHATMYGNVMPMFALEDELQGREIGDAFAALEPVQCWIPNRGDVVLAILADGQNVAIGDLLISHGDGYLMKYTSSKDSDYTQHPNQIVGMAMEAKNISTADSSGGALDDPTIGFNARIKVRIL